MFKKVTEHPVERYHFAVTNKSDNSYWIRWELIGAIDRFKIRIKIGANKL